VNNTVSALVVSYYTGPRLKDCLYALVADPEVDEIILVDNGNEEKDRRWLERLSQKEKSVSLLKPGQNLGFGKGVNLAAKTATGSHFLVINPDAILRWKSVSALIATLANAKGPTIVGGRIFDLNGQEARGCRRKELTLFRAVASFLGWDTWTLLKTPEPDGPIEVGAISGALFMMTREGFNALGGFDERYFLHVEDIDLCQRCLEFGGSVIYQPAAAALHIGATSDAPSRTVAMHKADSLAVYFRTHTTGFIKRVLVEAALPVMRLGLWFRSR